VSTIRSRDECWEAVHAALDARRDPLADAAVVAWLTEHPDDLDAALHLDRSLRALGREPRRRGARPFVGIGMGVGVAAAVALVFVLRRSAEPPRPRSAIVDYHLRITTETPTGRDVVALDNGTCVREREEQLGKTTFATLSTSTRKEGLR
jgi:hypothetical protein